MTGEDYTGGPAPRSWPDRLVEPVSAASRHLTDAQIVAGRPAEAEKHLVDCGWCAARVRDAAPADNPDDVAFLAALRARDRRLDEPAWTSAVPSKSVLAVAGSGPAGEDVRPGELWTVSWHGTSHMVAVVAIDRWLAQVVPVTTDARLADEYAAVVGAVGSPLEVPLALWGRASAWLAAFVFDRRLAVLPELGGQPAGKALARLLAAYALDVHAPADLPVGARVLAGEIDRVGLVESLTHTMLALARANDRLDALVTDPAVAAAPTVDVAALLGRAGLPLGELAARTGLTPDALRKIKMRGSATRAEAEAIGAALGVAAEDLIGTPFAPDALVLAASRPSRREQRRRWTAERYGDEDPDDPLPLIRHILDHPVAARTVPSAAAGSAGANQRHWDDRVSVVLATTPEG